MSSLKARVVTAAGTRVRNVRVDVKPVIQRLAETPAKPSPPKPTPPKPTPPKPAPQRGTSPKPVAQRAGVRRRP